MLGLTKEDLALMKATETRVIEESRKAYSDKKARYSELLKGRDMEEVLLEKMTTVKIARDAMKTGQKLDANRELKEYIEELSWERFPVILLGGSFNTEKRATKVTPEGIKQLKSLMEFVDPEEICFVIGHKLSGYEKYLLEHNDRRFKIYAVVPSLLSKKEIEKLKAAGVGIRVSTESEGMGIYKSFNYEIFERRPSMVVAFDGNSAGANLIQEARNGKGKSAILVWNRSKALQQKAKSLQGYVEIFDEENGIVTQIRKIQEKFKNSNISNAGE
jgi:hypothetical protein